MAASATDKFTKSYSFLQKSLGATISDVATSLTLNNYTNIPTDTKVHFIIDRIDSNGNRTNSTRELVSGISTGSAITNVSRGLHGTTAQSHDAGAVVEFVMSGAAWNDLVDGILVEHNQDGTHSDVTADSVTTTDLTVTGDLTISGVASDGWTSTGGTHSVATGYNAGNRSFTIDTSTDLSSIVSEGMRYRVTRNTTPPTQCADLEASSSHYASKSSPTGMPTGTTISFEAWIKQESYTGTIGIIIGRYTANDGFIFRTDASGLLQIVAGNSGAFDVLSSYQSVPLNKWVHVAGTLTINSGGTLYMDGVAIPSTYTNTAATSIGNAGDLAIGVRNYDGTQFFDGKLADVRVWSDIRTATEIQDNMYAYPSDTTGLVAHFKLNGDFTDASSNGNDLTAQNSAVATNADNPWNATEYGIITAVSASDIQVFCPEGYGIPNETLTAPYYSTQSAPYGFPYDDELWQVSALGNFSDLVDIIKYACPNPVRNIQYTNTGTAGGSFYCNINGNNRWVQGITASISTSTTPVSRTVVYPTGFFNEAQRDSFTVNTVTSVATQYVAGASSPSTTATSFYAQTVTGTGSLTACFAIYGS